MGRKKNNGKRDAALLREAAKRGEAIDKVNHNHNQLPSFNNDNDEYELEPSSDSEPEPLNHQVSHLLVINPVLKARISLRYRSEVEAIAQNA